MIRRPSAAVWALLFAVIAGAGLRLWTLGFFEFKEEQLGNLLAGLAMPERHFLVNHGIASTVGFPNGPGLFQIMGVWALAGARTPFAFAACGVAASIAGCVLFYLFLKRRDAACAVSGAWLIAASPMAILLAANIWPHSYLGLLAAAILWLAASRGAVCWCAAWLLAVWTGTVHLSAFFLLPGLAVIGWRRHLTGRAWAVAAAGTFALLAPWLWFLCFQWERETGAAEPGRGLIGWLWEWANGFGGGWLAEYVDDPVEPIRWLFGTAGGWALIVLAAVPPWIGVGRTLAALKRRETVPEWVETALILSLSVAAGYAVLGVRLYFFYFVVILPMLAALAAYGWSRFRSARLRRGLPLVWSMAALMLTATALAWFWYHGGDPREYGPHIGFWNDCCRELEAERAVAPLRLEVAAEGPVGDKLSPLVAEYFLAPCNDPAGRPCRLTIGYDPIRRCYYHRFVFAE